MALENKWGITSSADLAREEEQIRKKAVELFEKSLLDQPAAGTFPSLQGVPERFIRVNKNDLTCDP